MKGKSILLLILALCLFSIILPTVLAQKGIFSAILAPFGDIEQAYENYGVVVDTIAYLIIFIGLAEWALGKRFSEKGGRTVTLGLALVLAVSAGLWEATSGFRLKAFGPVALGLFLLLMSLAVYEGLRKHEIRKGPALAVAYLVFGTGVLAMGLFAFLGDQWTAIPSIMGLVWIIAAGYLIYTVFKGRQAGVSVEEGLRRPFDEGAEAGAREKEARFEKEQGILAAAAAEARAKEEKKFVDEEIALISTTLEVLTKVQDTMQDLDSGKIKVTEKQFKELAKQVDDATVKIQLARSIGQKMRGLAEDLDEKIKKIGEDNASDDAKDMHEMAKELIAMETTIWRKVRRLPGKIEKGPLEPKERKILTDLIDFLNMAEGHIVTIKKDSEKIIRELEEAAAKAKAAKP